MLSDLFTGLINKPGQITTAHVALHNHATLAVFATDLIGPLCAGDVRQVAQWPRGRDMRIMRAAFGVAWEGDGQIV